MKNGRYGTFAAILVLMAILSGGISPVAAADTSVSMAGPYVDKIVYNVMPEDDVQVLALLNDEIDLIGNEIDPVFYEQLGETPDIATTERLRNGYGFFTINCRKYPLNYTAFRRAFAFALDKERISQDAWNGFSVPQDSVVPQCNPFSVEGQLPYTYYEANVALGNQLLDAAGFLDVDADGLREAPDGSDFQILIETAQSSSIAMEVGYIGADALQALNIDAASVPTAFDEYLTRLNNHLDYDICFLGWQHSNFDVDWLAYEFWGEYADQPFRNFPNFANATYDSWRDQLLHSSDYNEVYEAAIEMQKVWVYECPEIVCYENSYLSAHRTDSFDGFVNSAIDGVPGWWTNQKVHLQDALSGPFEGTLRWSLPQDVEKLHPLGITSAYTRLVVDELYSSMLRIAPDGTDTFDLAKSYTIETHVDNPDVPVGHTRLTFNILQNVTWSDGTQLSASDVAFSINYIRDHDLPEAAGLEDLFAAYAPTDYQFVAEFTGESYWFLHNIAYKAVIPKHVWRNIDDPWSYDCDCDELVTSGPFYVSDRVFGEFIELTKNPDYYYPAVAEESPDPPAPSPSLSPSLGPAAPQEAPDESQLEDIIAQYADILTSGTEMQDRVDPVLRSYLDTRTVPESVVTTLDGAPKILVYVDSTTDIVQLENMLNLDWAIDLNLIKIIAGSVDSPNQVTSLSNCEGVLYIAADRGTSSVDAQSDGNFIRNSEEGLLDMDDIREVVGANEAALLGYDGSGVTIGLHDTGVDFSIPDLQDAMAVDENGYPLSYDPNGWGLQIMTLANCTPVEDIHAWLEAGNVLTYSSEGKYYLNTTVWDPHLTNAAMGGDTRCLLGFEPPYGEGRTVTGPIGFIGTYEKVWVRPGISEFVAGEMWRHWEIPAPTSEDYRVGWIFEQRMESYAKVFAPAIIMDKTDLIIDWNGSIAWTKMWNWWMYYETINITDSDDQNMILSMMDWSFVDDSDAGRLFRVNQSNILAVDLDGDDVSDWGLGSFTWLYDAQELFDDEPLFCGMRSDAMGFALMYPQESMHGQLTAAALASRGVTEHEIHNDGVMYKLPGIANGSKLIAVIGGTTGSEIGGAFWSAGFHLDSESGWWVFTGEHKADLVCNPWTYTSGSYLDLTYLSLVYDLIATPGLVNPLNPGALFITSSGNHGADYATSSPPATAAAVVSVGGSSHQFEEPYTFRKDGEIEYYSSNGPSFIGMTKPDVVAPSMSAVGPTQYTDVVLHGETYHWWEGTSFSCSVAGGVAAIIYQAMVEHSFAEGSVILKEVLLSSASDLGFDPFVQGHGLVNAESAVSSIVAGSSTEYYFHNTDSCENYADAMQDAWEYWVPNWEPFGVDVDPSITGPPRNLGMSSIFFGNVNPGETVDVNLTAFGYDGNAHGLTAFETTHPWYYRKSSEYTFTVDTYVYVDTNYGPDAWRGGFYSLTELFGPEGISDFLDSTYATITVGFDADSTGMISTSLFDWQDRDENGILTYWNDDTHTGDYNALITRDDNTGNLLLMKVADTTALSNVFHYTPTLRIDDIDAFYGGSTSVEVTITLWEKASDSDVAVTAGLGTDIHIDLSVPIDAEFGIKQGFIHFVDSASGYEHQVPYSYMVTMEMNGAEAEIHSLVNGWGLEQSPYESGTLGGSFKTDSSDRIDWGGYRVFHIEIPNPSAEVLILRADWEHGETVVDIYLRGTESILHVSSDDGWSGGGFYPSPTESTKNTIIYAPGGSINGSYYLLVSTHVIDGINAPENVHITLQWFSSLAESVPIISYTSNWDSIPTSFQNGASLIGDHVVISADWSEITATNVPEYQITTSNLELFRGLYFDEWADLIVPTDGSYDPFGMSVSGKEDQFSWMVVKGLVRGDTVRVVVQFTNGDSDIMGWIGDHDPNNYWYSNNVFDGQMASGAVPESAEIYWDSDNDTLIVACYSYDWQPGGWGLMVDTRSSLVISESGDSVSYDTYYYAPDSPGYLEMGSNVTVDILSTAYTNTNVYFQISLEDVTFCNFFPPQVTVTSPNGGETWTGVHDITWSIVDDNFQESHISDVYVSNDGGETFMLIAAGIEGEAYAWDLASWQIADTYAVMVQTTDGYSWSVDVSDDVFTAGAIPIVDNRLPDIRGDQFRTIVEGEMGNYINWHAHDLHPATAEVWLDSTLLFEEAWTSFDVYVSCDFHTVGVYNYTLNVIDILGNQASMTTMLTVQTTLPTYKIWHGTVAFEDWYDDDYNDWISSILVNAQMDGEDDIYAMDFQFEALACGAGQILTQYLRIPAGTFESGGTYAIYNYDPYGYLFDVQGPFLFTPDIDIDTVVFPNSDQALIGPNVWDGSGVSPGAMTVVTLVFENPIILDNSQYTLENLGVHGEGLFFDPWLWDPAVGEEIHLGHNWMLIVPPDWFWPQEPEAIWNVYPIVDAGPPVYFPPGWYNTAHTDLIWQPYVDAGKIVFDYSHGQYHSVVEWLDYELEKDLVAWGYEVVWAWGGLNETILADAKGLVLGSIVGEESAFTATEITTIANWFNSGGKFLWVGSDSDYTSLPNAGQFINDNMTAILSEIGSHLYPEPTSIEDPESNVGAPYRVIANITSNDPVVYDFVEGVDSVLMHGPTCIYGSTSGVAGENAVALETVSLSNVFPLLYYSSAATIVDNDLTMPIVHGDGEVGSFVAAALEINAGAARSSVLVVSGASPYGSYRSMYTDEYYGIMFNGYKLVRQTIHEGMQFVEHIEPEFQQPPEYLQFDRGGYQQWIDGDAELYNGYVNPGEIDLARFDVYPTYRNGYGHLTINCDKYPFNITAFRRALAFALDKNRISSDVWEGETVPVDSIIPQVNPFSIEGQLPFSYYASDYETANLLLDAAGFLNVDDDEYREAPDGSDFTVLIETAQSPDIALQIGYFAEETLQAMGIDAVCQPTDFWEYMDRVNEHGDYDIVFYAQNFNDYSLEWLRDMFWSGYADEPNMNPTNFRNATLDSWINSMLGATSYSEAFYAASQVQNIIAYECPFIITYQNIYNYAVPYFFRDVVTNPLEGIACFDTFLNMLTPYPEYQTVTTSMDMSQGINPFTATHWYAADNPMSLIYEGLARMNATGSLVPGLAESWSISLGADSANITIVLAAGTLWHDMTSVTTDDIAFTYSYMSAHEIPLFQDAVQLVTNVDIIDSRTLCIHVASTSYWDHTALLQVPILPEYIWSIIADPYTVANEAAIGSGPFMMSSINQETVFGLHEIRIIGDDLAALDHPEVATFWTDEAGDYMMAVNFYSGTTPLSYNITVSYDGFETVIYGTLNPEDIITEYTVPWSASGMEKHHLFWLPVDTEVTIVLNWDNDADLDAYLWRPSQMYTDVIQSMTLQRWHDYHSNPHEPWVLSALVRVTPRWQAVPDFEVLWQTDGPYDIAFANVTWAFSSDNATWSEWNALAEFEYIGGQSGGWLDFNAAPGEGYYLFHLETVDMLGHEASSEYWVGVDMQPPIADAGPNLLVQQWHYFNFDGASSWDNMAIANFQWTFVDDESVTLWGPTPGYTFVTNGTFLVTLTVTDFSGYQSNDTIEVLVLYDEEPPETTVTGLTNETTVAGNATYYVNSTDTSGVNRTEIYLDGYLVLISDSAVVEYTLDPSLIQDGEHILTIKVYDSFGHEKVTVYVVFTDTTPPETTVEFPEVVDETPTECTVDPSDESEIDRVEFWLDGELVYTDYIAPYVYTVHTPDLLNREHNLTIIVYDTLGNYVVEVRIFIIDKETELPTNPTDFDSSHLVNYWSGIRTIDVEWFNAYDGLSGVYGYSIVWDDNPLTIPDMTVDTTSSYLTTSLEDYVWYLHIRTRDNAGNWAEGAFHIGPFKIDGGKPSTFAFVYGTQGQNEWYIEEVYIYLFAFDAPGGVEYIYYKLDEGAWQIYIQPFPLSSSGVYVLEYYSVDYLGHESAVKIETIEIDADAPTVSASLSGTVGLTGEYVSPVEVTINAGDLGSGVSYIEYKINDGSWTTYSGQFTMMEEDYYSIFFYAVDMAGHVSELGATQFWILGPMPSLELTWATGNIGIVHDIAIADLDGNGFVETILAIESSYGAGHVNVYNATTQSLLWTIPMSDGYARCLAVGDPDNDGEIELVVGTSGTWETGPIGRIRIFDGATGTLEWESETHDGIHTVAITDVDADGHDEIVAISIVERVGGTRVNGTVMIFDGQTHALEWESDNFGQGLGEYAWIGNIDEDPALEIIFGGRTSFYAPITSTLWIVDGGTHEVQATLDIGSYFIMGVAGADLEGDGELDIVVSLKNQDETCGYIRAFNPSLVEKWHIEMEYVLPCTPALVNLDMDPALEIAVGVYDSSGDWQGHFRIYDGVTQGLLYRGHDKNGAPVIFAGDVTHDGFTNIAVGYHAGWSSGSMEVYSTGIPVETEETSAVALELLWATGDIGIVQDIAAGDLDGDGYNEILTAIEPGYGGSGHITVFDGRSRAIVRTLHVSVGYPRAIAISDIDGDGSMEVIVATHTTWEGGQRGRIYIFDGSTGTLEWESGDYDGFGTLAIVDVDADSELEIVVIGSGSRLDSAPTEGHLYVFDGATHVLEWSSGGYGFYLGSRGWVANIDSDPAMEIIFGGQTSVSVPYESTLYVVDGLSHETEVTHFLDDYRVISLVVADIEGDGSDEIIAGLARAGDSHFDLRAYDSSLTELWRHDLGSNNLPLRVNAWNLDGDSAIELVVGTAYATGGWIGDFLILDGITREVQYQREPLSNTASLELADVDSDGFYELLVGYHAGWSSGIMEVYSTGIPVVIETAKPTAPVLVDPGIVDDDGIISLSWSESLSLSGQILYYELQMSNALLFDTIIGDWAMEGLGYQVSGLFDGYFYFRVRAVDSYGLRSSWSNIEWIEVVVDVIPPVVDNPDDITYEEGASGHWITWTSVEANPLAYVIYKDGIPLRSGLWDGSPISTSVDGLLPGNYSITIIVYDHATNNVSNTVFVTVIPNEQPIIDSPDDITYEAGTTGYSITWSPYDMTPIEYQVLRNGILLCSAEWDGSPVTINIDDHYPGVYEYTLVVFDGTGNDANDTVMVYVVDTIPPVINAPFDVDYELGATGHCIEWTPTDLYPNNYELYINSGLADSGLWDGSSILVDVDGLLPGYYRYNLFVYDTSGNYVNDTVIVIVYDTTLPVVTIVGISEGQIVADQIPIEVTLFDLSPIDRVEFLIDGFVVLTDYEAPYELILDTTTLIDGTHVLLAKGYDIYENIGDAIVSFSVDNTPPQLESLDQSFFNGIPSWTLQLDSSVSDANEVTSVIAVVWSTEGYLQNIALSPAGGGVYAGAWDTTGAQVGRYFVDIITLDYLGNEGFFYNMTWASLYDYIKLDASIANLYLVDSFGQVVNATHIDFYDIYGKPLAYYFDDGMTVELLLLDPADNIYQVSLTHYSDEHYTLCVMATYDGATIHDASYEAVPFMAGEIHKYLVHYNVTKAYSTHLPEVLVVVSADKLYAQPGDYVFCYISWLNIDPGRAESVEIQIAHSHYLEFLNSSYPVDIGIDLITIYLGAVDGFSSGNLQLNFSVNLLAYNNTVHWLNATMIYTDVWMFSSYLSQDRHSVTVVTEYPDQPIQKSSWWKSEFSAVLTSKTSAYNESHLQALVDMVSYSSEVLKNIKTLTQVLAVLREDDSYGDKAKAIRELYALWLNVANEALAADTSIDIAKLTDSGTVGEAIIECEGILLDPNSTKKDYKSVEDICGTINKGKF